MKVIKRKGSDKILYIAQKVRVEEPKEKEIVIKGVNLIEVDETGKEKVIIGGCRGGFEVVDFDGDIPNDVLDGYELVDGKLKKVKP